MQPQGEIDSLIDCDGRHSVCHDLAGATQGRVVRRSSATVLLNQTADVNGQSFPVSVTGNTIYSFGDLCQDVNVPSLPDNLANNLMLSQGAPPLDTSHPFDTPEPASGAILGLAMLAAAVLRRTRISSGRSCRG